MGSFNRDGSSDGGFANFLLWFSAFQPRFTGKIPVLRFSSES